MLPGKLGLPIPYSILSDLHTTVAAAPCHNEETSRIKAILGGARQRTSNPGSEKNVRLGFFCNMNNSFFSLVRYARDQGVEAHLLRFANEKPQFHPSWDSVNQDDGSYVIELPWGRSNHLFQASKESIKTVLDDYTAIIACGSAPAYFRKAGRPADLLIPYGGDILDLPFRTGLNVKKPRKSLHDRYLAKYQRKGIQEAKAIITELGMHNEYIERIGFSGKLIDHHFPAVYDYTAELNRTPEILESEFGERVREVRKTSNFVVFHHARHIWKTYIDKQSWKGNDSLIKGFADFLPKSGAKDAKLILLDYGPDVDESKALIGQLSMDAHVVWLPLSPRKLILYGLLNCDVATGHFGLPCNLNGVTQEALLCGKPLLHRRLDSRHDADTISSLYPVYDVASPDEISSALEDLFKNPRKREKMGAEARRWYKGAFTAGFFGRFWEALGGEPHQGMPRVDQIAGVQ